MAKLINNIGSTGPYPGRTWKEEADAVGDSPFGFSVIAQIDKGKCDHWDCRKPVDEHYHCCSKECYDLFVEEHSRG